MLVDYSLDTEDGPHLPKHDHDLEDLVIGMTHRLRLETTIIEFGNDYGLWDMDLYVQGGSNLYAHDFLYYAWHDGIDKRGEKAEVPVEEAAEEAAALLEKSHNWRTWAFENGLKTVFITARRSAGAARRYLYSGEGGAPGGLPGDPLIVF